MAVESETLKQFLVSTPFFGGLCDDSLDRLTSMLTEKFLPAGEEVFHEGDTGRSMYVIESGQVLMKRRASSCEVKLVRLHRGDFFGETTLIEMQPRPWTAVVVEDARLFELTGANLYRLYKEDIKAYVLVLQNINREMGRRLRNADNRIAQLADELGDEGTQIRMVPGILGNRR